jgi:hypothetical protein
MSPLIGSILIVVIFIAAFVAQHRFYTSRQKFTTGRLLDTATTVSIVVLAYLTFRDAFMNRPLVFGVLIATLAVLARLPFFWQYKRVMKQYRLVMLTWQFKRDTDQH